ncbi:MAG TPA: DUF5668 domain-containing protein [Burkholderiaceae bacterium]
MDQLLENKRHARKRIFWGLILVGLGVMFLCEHFETLELAMMWRFWPLVLLVSGLIDVLAATRWKHIGEGLNQIVIGFWFFACLERLWGFTWFNSWPVLLIGAGVNIVLNSLPDHAQNKS